MKYFYVKKYGDIELLISEDAEYIGRIWKDAPRRWIYEKNDRYKTVSERITAIRGSIGNGYKEISELQYRALRLIKENGYPDPVLEFEFAYDHKWRFDFAFTEYRIAIEIDGGTWVNGRHTRGKGYANDARKGNAASILGWRVLHYTTDMIDEIIEDLDQFDFSEKGKKG